jgi:hypothetical protein
MQKQVTIGVPIYKRLNYLPDVLRIVAAQDYPNVELLVSDNGMNGRRVHEIVAAHYARPHRVRQNPSTVPMSLRATTSCCWRTTTRSVRTTSLSCFV